MGKISEIFNFDNIGGKIKNFAKWSCWITILLLWIATPILMVVSIVIDGSIAIFSIILLPLAAIIASLLIWVGSWAMYAFGELVEKTCDNESNIRQILDNSNKSNKSKSNSSVNKEQNDFKKKEKETIYTEKSKDEYKKTKFESELIDVTCPHCEEELSFLKDETDAVCPWCNNKISLE